MHLSTLPTPLNWGRTYSRMRLSSALRPRTIRPCTAHDTQYCCLMYSLGRVYSTSQPRIAKRTLVNGSVADISLGRRVHDVSHLETLHGLILRAHTQFPPPLPCRRNDRSGCSGRGSRDLFPSWNDHGFFKRVNPNAQPTTHHTTTNAQNGHLPALERHAC